MSIIVTFLCPLTWKLKYKNIEYEITSTKIIPVQTFDLAFHSSIGYTVHIAYKI